MIQKWQFSAWAKNTLFMWLETYPSELVIEQVQNSDTDILSAKL